MTMVTCQFIIGAITDKHTYIFKSKGELVSSLKSGFDCIKSESNHLSNPFISTFANN